MSGSIKWQVYTDDTGEDYAVKLDESNGAALGFGDYTGQNIGVLPRGFKMRGVNAINQEDGRRRFFPVGTQDTQVYAVRGTVLTLDSVQWAVTSRRGEKAPIPFAFDTELDDGTAT